MNEKSPSIYLVKQFHANSIENKQHILLHTFNDMFYPTLMWK